MSADTAMPALRACVFVIALVTIAYVAMADKPFWWQRGKGPDRKTIVDLATLAMTPATFATEILGVGLTPAQLAAMSGLPNAHPMTDLNWHVRNVAVNHARPGAPIRYAGPKGDPSTLLLAESNDSPPRRGLEHQNGRSTMKPATPKNLRGIADEIEAAVYLDVWAFADGDATRLRLLADAMEKPYDGAPTGDVIARFVGLLADNINDCQGRGMTTVISPLEARKLHAAIIEEGMQTAESLAKAGLAAVRAEDRATEMAGLVDEQARLIDSLRRSIRRLSDMLTTADDERVEVKFVFVPDPLGDPSAMGVEEAMDLALAIDATK